jgi:hypothetical protein
VLVRAWKGGQHGADRAHYSQALGLNPQELQAVAMEHTQVLPDSLN